MVRIWPLRHPIVAPPSQPESPNPAPPAQVRLSEDPFRNAGTVLVVDDIPANAELLAKILVRQGYGVRTASNGKDALDAMTCDPPDVVLTDVMMPAMDGFTLCQKIKRNPATRLIPVVLITALSERDDRLLGIDAGADDFLTKPVDAHELIARVRSLVRLKRHTDDLDSAETVILSLALTVEARDPYTHGHCQRLADYATTLGARIGLSDEDLGALRRGGVLHDVGKVGIPDAVLLKPGRLTVEEFEQMKLHTVIGDRLCGELRSLRRIRPIVRHHHERLDGGGYPDGLKGDETPLLAQIMCIVDIYDALTTARPYKSAMAPERAFEELSEEVKKGWRRRELVDEFIALGRGGLLRRTVEAKAVPRGVLVENYA